MSSLLARIMFAIFMLPLAALVYVVIFFSCAMQSGWSDDVRNNLLGGIASWIFIAIYWHLLWRSSVRWNQQRVVRTVLAMAGAIGLSAVLAWLLLKITEDGDFASFIGAASAPLFWVVATVFIWRETPAERGLRVRGGEGGSRPPIVWPAC